MAVMNSLHLSLVYESIETFVLTSVSKPVEYATSTTKHASPD